ncbi:hypothetical protein WVIC16_50074 [Weissella viridescens]|nr:hypothetical protein WVIC16_50074 [Weissella viridescens]
MYGRLFIIHSMIALIVYEMFKPD